MFQIDFTSRIPIFEQIFYNLIKLASVGAIKPGDKLPPVRTLASQLGVNPNTVAKAYKSLEQDKFIETAVGRGSYLSEKLTTSNAKKIIACDSLKNAVITATNFGYTKQEIFDVVTNALERGENYDRNKKSD